MSIYDNETSRIYPDLNLTSPQEPQTYCLNKLTDIEAYLLDKIEVRELPKKHCGYRPNYINRYYWRSFYCHICKCCWPACWYCLK